MIKTTKRTAYMICGWISLVMGIIGIFVPVWPTAPFVILAAYCFKNGSDKWHQWLLRQPKVGQMIIDWEQDRIIRPRAKIISVTMICCSIACTWYFNYLSLRWKLGVSGVLLIAVVFILLQRSSRRQLVKQ